MLLEDFDAYCPNCGECMSICVNEMLMPTDLWYCPNCGIFVEGIEEGDE